MLRLQLGQLQHACAPGLLAPWLVPRHLSCTHGSHAPLIGCAELLGSADLAPGTGLSVRATGVKSCEGEASWLACAVLRDCPARGVAADVCKGWLKPGGCAARAASCGRRPCATGERASSCDLLTQHMLGTWTPAGCCQQPQEQDHCGLRAEPGAELAGQHSRRRHCGGCALGATATC